jgi:hypothetical protein
MDVGGMIEWAFKALLRHWKPLVSMVLLVQGPVVLLSAFAQGRIFADLDLRGGQTFDGSPPDLHLVSPSRLALTVLVGFVSFLVLQPALRAATHRATIGAYLNEEPDARRSLRFGFLRFPSILLITVLGELLLAAVAVPLIVLGILLALTSRSSGDGGATFASGFAALIFIPAVIATLIAYLYVGIRLTFAGTVLVAEGLRGRAALRRSWRLIEGRFWRVFGVRLVGAFLAGIVSFAFATVAGLAVDGDGVGGNVVRAVATLAGQALAIPFVALLSTALFFAVRAERQPFDPTSDLAQLRTRDPRSG